MALMELAGRSEKGHHGFLSKHDAKIGENGRLRVEEFGSIETVVKGVAASSVRPPLQFGG